MCARSCARRRPRPSRPRRKGADGRERLLAVAGGLALFSGLVLVAILARPAPGGLPGAVETAGGVSTVDLAVPPACLADVRGRAFASGTLQTRIDTLRAYARSEPGQPATLVLTDGAITDSVRAQIAGAGAPPFRDPAVTIRPDGIRVSGTATAAFLRFPVRATLVPEVSGGQLRFAVRDLETGGLPAAFRPRVNELLDQAADPASWRLPLAVEDVVLRSGCGSIRGRTTG